MNARNTRIKPKDSSGFTRSLTGPSGVYWWSFWKRCWLWRRSWCRLWCRRRHRKYRITAADSNLKKYQLAHDAAKFAIDNERGKTRLTNLNIRIVMFTTVDVFIRNYCPYCSVHDDDNGHDGHWPFIIMPRKFYRTLTSTSSIAISPIG